MKKIILLLAFTIIGTSVFADDSTKINYFMLPELILFGEEQFYLLPFPLREQIREQTFLSSFENEEEDALKKEGCVNYEKKLKPDRYPGIFNVYIPEKISLIDSYIPFLTALKLRDFTRREREERFTLFYSPSGSFYSAVNSLFGVNLWNYSFDFEGNYNSLSDIYSIISTVQLERNRTLLPLNLKLLCGSGFRIKDYMHNLAEASLKLKYSYGKADVFGSMAGLVTSLNSDFSSFLTGTVIGKLKIEQSYARFLPAVSIMGALWNNNYTFVFYPEYKFRSLSIGAVLWATGTEYSAYPALFYRTKINDILSISLYSVPEFGMEKGLENYLIYNFVSETSLPVSSFEKYGLKLSADDRDGNNGYLSAEILHGGFLDLEEINTGYTYNTLLNIIFNYSQRFSNSIYGGFTYKFQKGLGYPFPFNLSLETPSHLISLKAHFDFIKIPLQIIINANILSSLLLGENFKWFSSAEVGRENEISAWFVFKPDRHYNFGMIFAFYKDKNSGAYTFENSFFIKSRTIKARRE